MTSTADTQAIEAALDAATPGPWEFGCGTADWHVTTEGEDCITVATTPYGTDGELIANAPTWLRQLLADNARLTAALGKAEEAIADHRHVRVLAEADAATGRAVARKALKYIDFLIDKLDLAEAAPPWLAEVAPFWPDDAETAYLASLSDEPT